MKYIVDMDSLKKCLGLLPVRVRLENEELVALNDVYNMIDSFPKDEIQDLTKPNYR